MFQYEVFDDTEKPNVELKSVALEHVCSVHPNYGMFCKRNPGYKMADAAT
jgi:hypothetical protein